MPESRLTPLEQEMLAALKRMEWSASIAGFSACPQCVATKWNGHKLGCFLASAIRKAEPRPRQWLVEEADSCENGSICLAGHERSTPVNVIREIKSITQEQVTAAISPAYYLERGKYVNFLRNLGIDVED